MAKAAEDLRSLQARKIVRLECSVAVFEAEVSHLSSAIAELEEQVRKNFIFQATFFGPR